MSSDRHEASMEGGQSRFEKGVVPLPMEAMDVGGVHDKMGHPGLALGSLGMNQEQEVTGQGGLIPAR